MARMADASWRPIPINFTANGQAEVRGVVVHIMAGTLPGTDSWFRNPKAQASSHFGTSKAGALYQWVDTKDRAWAQAGGNPSWLSVENEGQGGDVLTDEQLDKNALVLAWSHQLYSVPLQVASGPSGRGLGWHAMGGSSWGGHTSCPGSKIVAQLPEIVRRAKNIIEQEEDPMAGMDKGDVFDASWNTDGLPAPKDAPDVKKNKFWTPSSYLRSIYNGVIGIRADLKALRAAVDKLNERK
ncbi:N-acetylmuramoyl-L-alanine amidase [Streptomyces sp. NPDC001705]